MKRATPVPFVLLVLLAAGGPVRPGAARRRASPASRSTPGDVAWMLTASALVLLMTPGLSFFYGGMVSFKNVVSTMLQSVVALGVISLVWVLVGLQPGVRRRHRAACIGNPLTFFMFDGVGEATHPTLCADDPAAGLRDVPAQVRDHHAGADHGLVRRAGPVLVVPAVHGPVQPVHLLPAGALDLAPGRVPLQVGREGLRRRDGRAHVGRLGGAGRGDDPGPAQEPPRQGGAHRRRTSRS